MRYLHCGPYRVDLDKPCIMAIINVTPDSFSGDGLAHQLDATLKRAEQAVRDGAGFLDIGGESTRPGAPPVSEQEELDRVVPVVEKLSSWGVPISVDTFKPAVMRASIAAGASLINDICALSQPGAIDAVAASDAAVCLMHMQGEPRTMQAAPSYDADVVAAVKDYLRERVAAVRVAGIDDVRIVLDPGFGFGKTVPHNYRLLKHLAVFLEDGLPILAGLSRKSMLGAVTGAPVGDRVVASVTAAVLAAEQGARILRVHDVAATRDGLQIWQAYHDAE